MNNMPRLLQQKSIRSPDGGLVPGRGAGDKVPAKYEPGEFVVSNDMLANAPALKGDASDPQFSD